MPPSRITMEKHDLTTREIRIVLADDHPIVRRGLRLTIENDPQLQVVAEATDAYEALAQIYTHRPAIAVLDIDMPKLDGFGVAKAWQAALLAPEIVFLTLPDAEDIFNQAMDLGAKGYILKESALIEIVHGIKSVASGQYFVPSTLKIHLLNRRHQAQQLTESLPGLMNLTMTELRILQLIAKDQSSQEIAEEIFINYRTVENHRTAERNHSHDDARHLEQALLLRMLSVLRRLQQSRFQLCVTRSSPQHARRNQCPS